MGEVALPSASSVTADPSGVPSTTNCTAPVGTLGEKVPVRTATDAVNATAAVGAEGLAEDFTVVPVGTVVTCCTKPARLSANVSLPKYSASIS